jgi:hypothetical protein
MLGKMIKSPVARWAAVPLALAGVWWGNDYLTGSSSSFTPNWNPAATTAAQKVSMSMVVASGVTLQSGRMILNDRVDWENPATKCVVVDTKRVTSAGNDVQQLVGKTVTVTGRPATYKGRPQVIADSISVK